MAAVNDATYIEMICRNNDITALCEVTTAVDTVRYGVTVAVSYSLTLALSTQK